MAVLGRYEVVKHLASGSMAELLLVRARGLEGFERHFVIKRIREDHESDQGFVDMFLAEARLAAVLHHHNIVQVHDIGEDNGKPYFAMEYVHGEDLRRLLAKLHGAGAKMPLEHVIAIICAAAAALHHAHDAHAPDRTPLGIVHRDVTPANILVGYDGNIKVVDFGIARAAMRRTETQVGMLAGKAPYMAPEQCTGGAIDRRSDVFSLGIVLFELITGRRLFKGENEFLTMSAVVEANVPPPSQHRDGVSKELDAIVQKALARDPAQRYQTAEQMFLALDELAVAEGLRSSGLSLAGYMRSVFGYRMEPWLVSDDDHATMAPVDYDGLLPGLAPPPTHGDKPDPLPSPNLRASPITVARASAQSDGSPSAATPPVRPPSSPGVVVPGRATAVVPALGRAETRSAVRIPDASGIAKPRTKTGAVPILGPMPARQRPKTVQIPVMTSAVLEDSPTQTEPVRDLLEVPLPGVPKLPTPSPHSAAPERKLAEAPTSEAAKLALPKLAEASSEIVAVGVPKVVSVENNDDDASTFTSVDDAFETAEPSKVGHAHSLQTVVHEPNRPRAGTDAPTFTERTAIDDPNELEVGASQFAAEPMFDVMTSTPRSLPGMPAAPTSYAQHDDPQAPSPVAQTGPLPKTQSGSPPQPTPASESPYPVYRSAPNMYGVSLHDRNDRHDRGSQEHITPLPPPPPPGDDGWPIEARRPPQGQPTWRVAVPMADRVARAKKSKLLIGGSVIALLLIIIIIGVATSGGSAVTKTDVPKAEPVPAPIEARPPQPISTPTEPAISTPPPIPKAATRPTTKKLPVKHTPRSVSPKKPKGTTPKPAKAAANPAVKASAKAPGKQVGWDPDALFRTQKK